MTAEARETTHNISVSVYQNAVTLLTAAGFVATIEGRCVRARTLVVTITEGATTRVPEPMSREAWRALPSLDRVANGKANERPRTRWVKHPKEPGEFLLVFKHDGEIVVHRRGMTYALST